jgi:hypothetical protein
MEILGVAAEPGAGIVPEHALALVGEQGADVRDRGRVSGRCRLAPRDVENTKQLRPAVALLGSEPA